MVSSEIARHTHPAAPAMQSQVERPLSQRLPWFHPKSAPSLGHGATGPCDDAIALLGPGGGEGGRALSSQSTSINAASGKKGSQSVDQAPDQPLPWFMEGRKPWSARPRGPRVETTVLRAVAIQIHAMRLAHGGHPPRSWPCGWLVSVVPGGCQADRTGSLN